MNITNSLKIREFWDEEQKKYEKFGADIKDEISKLLKTSGIYAKTSFRTKEVDSLIKKLSRKDKTYDDIHDKVGVRAVVQFKDNLYKADSLFKEHFGERINKREDMCEKLGENIFGYQSIHYDISDIWDNKKVYCELQLRTICQDNWSELSHAIAYKSEINIPLCIKREINALSAVFELADNQFQHIQNLINQLPDTNPIRIMNYLEKMFYTYLGSFYDKELTSYFLKNIENIYDQKENPIELLKVFIDEHLPFIVKKVEENSNNAFFTQPEIIVILERLQNRKYDLCMYWEQLYELDELESIANSWGTSIL